MVESASPASGRFCPAGLSPLLLRRASLGGAAAIGAGAAIAALVNALPGPFGPSHWARLTTLLFWEQDLAWLVVGALLLLALAWSRPPLGLAAGAAALARRPAGTGVALAGLGVAIAALGTFAVFHGFHSSRDEIMAEFDATILRSGRLVAAVPPEWRDLHRALVPDFLLPVPGATVWASSYLPGNAALRALVGLVADPGWTGPLLVGMAILALFAVARRLWPGRPDAVAIATLLLASSSQVLVTGMTSYAMSAHLALNLVWLLLFLRDDRLGHVGACAVGFIACGLHQLVFHPLFAAPFVLRLWTQRRRSLALGYAAIYAAIGVFWILYWRIVLAGIALPPGAASQVGAEWFAVRALYLIANLSWDAPALMLDNLLRFIAWQHLLLLPLVLAAAAAVRRDDGIAAPLAAGIALTLIAMFILLPYQGHGWGYRYLHGLIGSVCLLAGYGWIAITARADAPEQGAAFSALAIATAFAVLVMLPVHIAQAGRMIAPYRAAVDAIERAPTDLVLVDPSGLFFAPDLVRNDPFLGNRPKVLDLSYIDDARMADLCARFSISVFDRRQAIALGLRENTLRPEDEAFRASRRALMKQLGCGVDVAIGAEGRR